MAHFPDLSPCRYFPESEGLEFLAIGWLEPECEIPAGEVSVECIAHYVDAHGFCPPATFQEAVLRCPEMRSRAFLEALLETDVRTWLRRFRPAP